MCGSDTTNFSHAKEFWKKKHENIYHVQDSSIWPPSFKNQINECNTARMMVSYCHREKNN